MASVSLAQGPGSSARPKAIAGLVHGSLLVPWADPPFPRCWLCSSRTWLLANFNRAAGASNSGLTSDPEPLALTWCKWPSMLSSTVVPNAFQRVSDLCSVNLCCFSSHLPGATGAKQDSGVPPPNRKWASPSAPAEHHSGPCISLLNLVSVSPPSPTPWRSQQRLRWGWSCAESQSL